MTKKIVDNLSSEFQGYVINEIASGASKKKIYRIKKNNVSFILIDFSRDKNEFFNYLKVYNLLINKNICIPKIKEKNEKKLLILSEDLGDMRFDKIMTNKSKKELLKYAVDNLIILKNSFIFDKSILLERYNINIFESEIAELPEHYFPYIGLKINKDILNDFKNIWLESFNKFDFDFNTFVHKDFNINNLILVPSNNGHLKCGIVDFQNAFWGESCWDLFSLLEDSRILFTDELNDYFVEYYFNATKQIISLSDFKIKFHFLNCSRQTRLLGRWVKLSKELNQNWYLDFISITLNRLQNSMQYLNDKKLKKYYNKYIFKK